MEKKTIRSVRGRMLNDDMIALASLLIKAGYAVRITTVKENGKQAKETVVQYWEE